MQGGVQVQPTMIQYKNDLILRAAQGQLTERPPVWLMRQAGRILPQYRAIRERLSGFKELVETPQLACEVTIQPVDELGVDAAIIFSDILVIPQALGLDYEMQEKRGPWFPKTIRTAADVQALHAPEVAAENLQYVYDAIRLTVHTLNGRVPLIGFAGAPWTIFAYMVEGSGSKTFTLAKQMLYAQPQLAEQLLDRITDATILYLQQQIAAGAAMIQLFDSWAGILSPAQYHAFSARYIRKICAAITEVPVTVFAKGAWFALDDFATMPCRTIGLDWNIDARFAQAHIQGRKTLQGNLDPSCLFASRPDIIRETKAMLHAFANTPYIANLGHGVYPETPLDHVRCFVDTIKAY